MPFPVIASPVTARGFGSGPQALFLPLRFFSMKIHILLTVIST